MGKSKNEGFIKNKEQSYEYYLEQRELTWEKDCRAKASIHPSIVIPANVTIWQNATICENTRICQNVVIGANVWIGKNCFIGNRVRIQTGAFIPNGTIIEDDVFIGPNVTMTDDKYPKVNNKYVPQPPHIEKFASIGAGAVILPGVRIKEGAMIGAGSVVTKNVSNGGLSYGIPAKEVKNEFIETTSA